MWSVRSGNRADERCRVERRASRRFMPDEGSPSFAADRRGVGLRTRAAEDAVHVLCPLSYVPEGRRDSNPQPHGSEGTPACATGRLGCQGARQLQRHRWLRGHGSNPDLLVQSQAWYQFHHLAWVWTGGLEPPTPGFRSRCAPVAPRPGWLGTDGRIRTDTDGGLSAVPLPVGLRQHEDPARGRRFRGRESGSRTRGWGA